jgi:beta-phosphoglucomutase-like phosphatase (HAD superfamily)
MAVKGTVRFNKQSLNKYSAIIFDLSGVLVDFGMHVPVIATSRVFRYHDIYIPEKHIRQNTNINTNLEQHIKTLCKHYNCGHRFENIYTENLQLQLMEL